MITIANCRHGAKEGDLISEECLVEIRLNGIPELNELIPIAKRIVIHLGTGRYRTTQTVWAYVYYLRHHGYADRIADFSIPASPKLGSKSMFDIMAQDPEYSTLVKMGGYAYAVYTAKHPHFMRARRGFFQAMNELLTYLEDGDLCISIGHNGVIETFGRMLSPEIVGADINLKELEGIIFEADAETKEYDPDRTRILRRKI